MFIYHHDSFKKPFFCAYIKSAMFTLYLLGFVIWPQWTDCSKPKHYVYIEPETEDESYYSDVMSNTLSNPVYVPVKIPDSNKNSDIESEEVTVRSVRFNKLAEVRHMSETEATEALLARLSYQATVRAGEFAKRAAIRLPILKVAKVAFIFCFLWFLANYMYQLSLSHMDLSSVNIVASSSGLFTLILTSIFPSGAIDKISLSKFIAVILGVLGIVLLSFSEVFLKSELPIGAVFSLLSALFYSLYLVFLKRKADDDNIHIPLFFGFVGLFNLALLWPAFFFLHFSELETFEWPSKDQLIFLVLNGIIGTVLTEALWLWAAFLTSSLMASSATCMSVPMTVLADSMLKKTVHVKLVWYTGGVVPMLCGFLGVAVLTFKDNWDPIYDLVRCLNKRRGSRFRFSDIASEQSEALIGINSLEHDA